MSSNYTAKYTTLHCRSLLLFLMLSLVPGYHIVVLQLATKDVERASYCDVHSPLTGNAHSLEVLLQTHETEPYFNHRSMANKCNAQSCTLASTHPPRWNLHV
jgi:hypothetical protein